ncbi:hypothetical protein ACFQV4_04370 [Streptomyces thermocarboxydus]
MDRGHGFVEVARREGDFALAGAAAVVNLGEDGRIASSPSVPPASRTPPSAPPRSSRRWPASCRPRRTSPGPPRRSCPR